MDMIDTNKKAFMKASEQLNLEDAHMGLTAELPGRLVVYNRSWLFASAKLEAPCGNDQMNEGHLVKASVLAAQHATATRFLPMGRANWEKISDYSSRRYHMDGRLQRLWDTRSRVNDIPTFYSLSEAFYRGDYEPRGAAGVDIRSKDVKQTVHKNHEENRAYFWFDSKPVVISTEIVKGLHSLGFELNVWIDEQSKEYDPLILMESTAIDAFGMVEPLRSRPGERGVTPDGRSMCIDIPTAAWTPTPLVPAELVRALSPRVYLEYVKSGDKGGRDRAVENSVSRGGLLGKAISVLRWSEMSDEEIQSIVEENVYPALSSLWCKEQESLRGALNSMCQGENTVWYYRDLVSRSHRTLEDIRKAIFERNGHKLDLPAEFLALEAGVQEIIGRRQG
jgi:hypothetical protein